MYVTTEKPKRAGQQVIQRQQIETARLNVIGERHTDDRGKEQRYLDRIYSRQKYGYWTETTFPYKVTEFQDEGDPQYLRFQFWAAAVKEELERMRSKILAGDDGPFHPLPG